MNPFPDSIKFHIDMDSFFASVEISRRPDLKGLPVVIGSDPKRGSGRGVVSTCSYEARRYGIHSAMPISKAYRLCPDAVYLPVNSALYKKTSNRIMTILRRFTERFEQVSVDEAYLDMGKKVTDYNHAYILAEQIKEEIFRAEGLTCSIGIAPGKKVAKIASDYNKPDGLTVVPPDKVKEFLASMPVSKIPGIGKKTEQMLREMNICTVGQLAEYDVQALISRFGKSGIFMKQIANGVDHGEIKQHRESKSISKEDTFEEDTADYRLVESVLMSLCEEVYRTMKINNFRFRTITLKVRFSDFRTYTRSNTLKCPAEEMEIIKRHSKNLIQEFIGQEKFRLVGIGISKLEKIDKKQTMITDFA